jgi:hypothetical protein
VREEAQMPLRCVVAMLAAVSIAPADTLALQPVRGEEAKVIGGVAAWVAAADAPAAAAPASALQQPLRIP